MRDKVRIIEDDKGFDQFGSEEANPGNST